MTEELWLESMSLSPSSVFYYTCHFLLTYKICLFSPTCLVSSSFQIVFFYLPIQFSGKWILQLKLSLRLMVFPYLSCSHNSILYCFIVSISFLEFGETHHSLKLSNENSSLLAQYIGDRKGGRKGVLHHHSPNQEKNISPVLFSSSLTVMLS